MKDLSNDTYAMLLCFLFSDFLNKSICCGYLFELHRLVDAIQMSTHNICLYRQNYTGCNLRTMELLECVLIGVCAVIRSNTVYLQAGLHITSVAHLSADPGVASLNPAKPHNFCGE